MSTEDWNALLSSEVFKEFYDKELQKEAQIAVKPQETKEEQDMVATQFMEFEAKIKEDPILKQAFKTWQDRLRADEDYARKTNPAFVQGVLMLDLDSEPSTPLGK